MSIRFKTKSMLPQPLPSTRLPQSNRAVSKCERCLTMIMSGCSLDPTNCDSFCGMLGYIGTTCFCDVVNSSEISMSRR